MVPGERPDPRVLLEAVGVGRFDGGHDLVQRVGFALAEGILIGVLLLRHLFGERVSSEPSRHGAANETEGENPDRGEFDDQAVGLRCLIVIEDGEGAAEGGGQHDGGHRGRAALDGAVHHSITHIMAAAAPRAMARASTAMFFVQTNPRTHSMQQTAVARAIVSDPPAALEV